MEKNHYFGNNKMHTLRDMDQAKEVFDKFSLEFG